MLIPVLPNLKVIEYSQGILNKSIIEEIPNFLVTDIELRCSSNNYKESLGMVVKFSRTSAQPQQPTDLLTTSINIQTVPPMLEVLHPLNFGQVEIASWSKDYSSIKKLLLFSGAIHPAVLKLTVYADLDTDAFLSLAQHFPEVEQIHISSADFVLKCDIQKLLPKLKRFIGQEVSSDMADQFPECLVTHLCYAPQLLPQACFALNSVPSA